MSSRRVVAVSSRLRKMRKHFSDVVLPPGQALALSKAAACRQVDRLAPTGCPTRSPTPRGRPGSPSFPHCSAQGFEGSPIGSGCQFPKRPILCEPGASRAVGSPTLVSPSSQCLRQRRRWRSWSTSTKLACPDKHVVGVSYRGLSFPSAELVLPALGDEQPMRRGRSLKTWRTPWLSVRLGLPPFLLLLSRNCR